MSNVAALHEQPDGNGWTRLTAIALAEGSLGHPYRVGLLQPGTPTRDLADAIHALCTVHGRHPCMAEDALARAALPDAEGWLRDAADGFAAERGYLARLVAAAGPLPSTPGQAGSEAALSAHRHALAMLARSDRRGCALGAVATLVVDWAAVRPVLDCAAERFGLQFRGARLPSLDTLPDALDAGAERATGFGAEQVAAQLRGFWDLVEARAEARG